MARSIRSSAATDFTKRGWRRRVLIRVVFLLAMLLAALIGVGVWVGKALPGIAAAEISRLTNTQIEMGAFDFHRNASVSIDGIVIRPERGELFYDDTILRAKSVYAKFSLSSLLLLSPQVTEIHVEDFILDVQHNLDSGRWNIGGLRLTTSSEKGRRVPVVALRRGKLRYCKASGGRTEVVTSVPVEARFGFPGVSDGSYGFEIKTAKLSGGYGDSALRGSWSPGRLEVAGGLSSTDIPSLERAWAVDVLAADLQYDRSGAYELSMQIRDLHSKHSPEVDAFRLIAADPARQSGAVAAAQRFFSRFRPFGRVASIRLQAWGNFHALQDSTVTGHVVCEDVSIRDSRFPYPIDHLAGTVEFSQSAVTLNRLQGKHGEVDVLIQGWSRGHGDHRQYQYQISSGNMVLDDDLYAALPPGQKRLWDMFSPRGVIGVDYWLTRSSPSDKRSHFAVDLRGVNAAYEKFPYPLQNMTGGIYFDRERIFVTDVVASGQGHQIRLNGQVTGRDTSRPIYNIMIDANGIPLDATLRQALPEHYQVLAGRFEATGTANAQARIFTAEDVNHPNPIRFAVDASVADASLEMDSWPLVLTDLSGEVSITPDLATIRNCVGRYRQSEVRLEGSMRFARGDRPGQYHLNVTTKQTPLDGTTLGLLPEAARRHVLAFRPEGAVDVTMHYSKVDSNQPADLTASIMCLGNKINHERFPYPLQNVRGTIAVDAKAVTFQDIEAAPALQSDPYLIPSVRVNGRLSLLADSRGEGAFTVRARDILFTPQLGESLPKSLQGIYRDSSPRGPFDLDLDTLEVSGRDHKLARLSGRMDLRPCSFHISGTGAEVYGTLDFGAVYDTEVGFLSGRIHWAADRFNVKGKDVTRLDAELVYDPNARVWSADHFLGDCYGGHLLGSLRIEPVATGVVQYLATIGLVRVDLQKFLLGGRLDPAAQTGTSSGTMNAALGLGARIGDGSSRLGVLRINVADMQVGRVSPLANLLAVLSLTEPTDYAFERMLVESYLKRDRLLISKFDMSGKNLAFTGSGTMNLRDSDVNLTLTARGRRVAAAKPSILQSLTEGLGGAVVRMEVTGKAGNPKVETKTLPVIEDSLKILGTPQ
ncbi:MAG TPA: hypothetical protein PLU87_14695 [Sedimentisphaerales bacterium]|nr:hypothetical protein [Sedimentisphaerales bacterium]HRS12354.1 hypothetical protein [Sedimentisphaerales bacterium]HRV48894.1 hypothetical protein [Sedimentisphaerales bacterium]